MGTGADLNRDLVILFLLFREAFAREPESPSHCGSRKLVLAAPTPGGGWLSGAGERRYLKKLESTMRFFFVIVAALVSASLQSASAQPQRNFIGWGGRCLRNVDRRAQ